MLRTWLCSVVTVGLVGCGDGGGEGEAVGGTAPPCSIPEVECPEGLVVVDQTRNDGVRLVDCHSAADRRDVQVSWTFSPAGEAAYADRRVTETNQQCWASDGRAAGVTDADGEECWSEDGQSEDCESVRERFFARLLKT